jgi:adenine-specific DNA-methyltransferase
MRLNAEDGGQRRFMMVQIPEECGAKTEAHKAGYANISEIGKERIRRAGAKLRAELAAQRGAPSTPDVGFRVYKLVDPTP